MVSTHVMPIVLAFIVSIIICPLVIPFLRKLRFGQYIRDDGPKWHEGKTGTPTMGGLVIMFTVLAVSLWFLDEDGKVLSVLFVILGFGVIGFLDDYIKVVMKRNLGLRAWLKMTLQIFVTVVFILFLQNEGTLDTRVIIPFTCGKIIELGRLYIPFTVVVLLGTVNGVNLTDGLDGLASGVTMLVAMFFNMAAIIIESDISVVSGCVAGSLLGFLIYNVYPARVFMGDTGSLALGGFVAATAIMLRLPLYIPIVGFIYFVETLSVILQVVVYKFTNGKRLFKMAPLHHHFELSGWPETKVVATFSIITAILCILALINLQG